MNRTLQVYKFGGASVKDAAALLNLHTILHSRLQAIKVIVVSAMGKTTNALEAVLAKKLGQEDFSKDWKQIKEFHVGVCEELFPAAHPVFEKLGQLMDTAQPILELPISKINYDEVYDQLICYGELLSSILVSEYLIFKGLCLSWQDVRSVIHTDSDFRFAKIDWKKTRSTCQSQWGSLLEHTTILTQGFIGKEAQG